MQEALLSTGSKGIFLGNSGPGPKTLLVGDTTLGYFGEVTDTQLFSPSQVAGATSMYVGTDNSLLVPGGVHWLKFIWNNKIIYIAKQIFRNGVSWNDLYASGLVYGTRDNGKYPMATPKHQYTQMVKNEGPKTWVLKPRLPTGFNVDPVPASPPNVYLGEWNQLFGRCVADANGGLTPKFANFGYNQTGWTQSSPDSLTMETNASNTLQNAVRGDGSSGQIISATRWTNKTDRTSGTTSTQGWRPVLELVPDTETKDPYQLSFVSLGAFPPVINNMVQALTTGAKKVVGFQQKKWAYQLPQPKFSFAGQAIKVTALKATFESPGGLKGFSITGSYVA